MVLAAAVLAACGSSSSGGAQDGGASTGALIRRDDANADRPPVVIGSKNFTEEYVLANIYARALKAAGYRVRLKLDLGDEKITYGALRSHLIDAYPEYTGTALTSFYGIAPEKIPHDVRGSWRLVRDHAARQRIVAMPPTPMSNTNGFAVTRETARRHHLRTLSDLKGAARSLSFSGAPECVDRFDCLKGLGDVYGVRFRRFVPISLADRYSALHAGRADVTTAFTTDGQIKTDGLVLLADDKGMLPPDNVTLLVRRASADALGPDFGRIVRLVQGKLTTATMRELNSRVDIDGQAPAAVAEEYLHENGYLQL